MRTLRWFMAAAVLLVMQVLVVAPASACIIDTFGVSPVSVSSDGTVPPGGTVSYSMRIVSTPDSPGDSRFELEVGGVVVASGMATPSATGEWTISSTFQMPALGPGKMQIRAQLRLIDTVDFKSAPTPLGYNGTPPTAAPPPETPAVSQTPVKPTSDSGAAPDPKPSPRRTHKPKPQPKPKPAPVRHAEQPATHVPASTPVHQTVPQAAPVAAPRAVADTVRTRPAARRVMDKPANRAIAHQALRTTPDPVAAPQVLAAPAPAAERHGPDGTALLLLLALLGGAGALAVVLRRRQAPHAPTPIEVDLRAAEIEAELQEIVAEGRLERERAGLS